VATAPEEILVRNRDRENVLFDEREVVASVVVALRRDGGEMGARRGDELSGRTG
jgi:hypothetical protein